MKLPKMRTLPEAIKEIREQDPKSALTLRALRGMANTGEIPCVRVGTKTLVNMDVLCECLYGACAASSAEYGKIRRLS